ncbi:MAG: YdeI/OmpD-associated family protein [Patescibacteria group bacterium]
MSSRKISDGVAHKISPDLRNALVADQVARALWEDLTPLARNEWICWVISVKTEGTRAEHVKRVVSELKEGMRRPCCWMGCVHRKDKPLSATQKFLLKRKTLKK